MRDKTFLSQIRLPTIRELRGLVYKKIFTGLSYQEAILLDRGLAFYPKTKLTNNQIESLISLNQLMIKHEKGEFREMKEKVKEFKLDYKQMYGVN